MDKHSFLANLPQDPVFIVGNGRSGTTLLQAMLAAQDDVYSFHESHYFSWVWKSLQINDHGHVDPQSLDSAFASIAKHAELNLDQDHRHQLVTKAHSESGLTPKQLYEELLWLFIGDKVAGKEYKWIDKTPGHALAMNEILEMYPDVKFIHVVRHPIAVVYSQEKKFPFVKKGDFGGLARKWAQVVQFVSEFKIANPDKVVEARYEDLTANPESTLNKIGQFVGIQIDTHRTQEFNKVAESTGIIFSPWHSGVSSNRIENNNRIAFTELPFRVRLKISTICRTQLFQYKYIGPFRRLLYQSVALIKPQWRKIKLEKR